MGAESRPMPLRTLAGREVGAIGLGCMPMSWFYDRGSRNDTEAVAVIDAALGHGVTLFDTADVYGPFTNETLLGRALTGRRDDAFLATKVGLLVDGASQYHRNGSRAHIHASCDASLQRLRTDHIDLYQLHRVDPAVPIEDSVQAMAELVQAGKVRAIGLSEVSVAELDRAVRITPIASVQSEFSLWTREPVRNGVLRWCSDHGAALLAYAPLGRGYLTGTIRSPSDLPADDFRRANPRFQPAALRANERFLATVLDVAERNQATAAQVALRWLLGTSPCVLPIPGTRRAVRVIENALAATVNLSPEDVALFDALPEPADPRY
jgi:aryl-alcohol dehydrogenase-like predicted oxidoreductase